LGGLFWSIVVGGAAALVGVLAARLSHVATAWRLSRFAEACREFHWQREHLEARFMQIAQQRAKPGSPRWADCDFSDDVAYVRNRYTGELSAFVAVSILLDLPPSKGQDGEIAKFDQQDHLQEHWRHGLGRAGAIREATAVFRLAHDRWETDGRAIFNLSPSETIRFYQHDLEMVRQEPAERR
jgi:hypothetical protein